MDKQYVGVRVYPYVLYVLQWVPGLSQR